MLLWPLLQVVLEHCCQTGDLDPVRAALLVLNTEQRSQLLAAVHTYLQELAAIDVAGESGGQGSSSTEVEPSRVVQLPQHVMVFTLMRLGLTIGEREIWAGYNIIVNALVQADEIPRCGGGGIFVLLKCACALALVPRPQCSGTTFDAVYRAGC